MEQKIELVGVALMAGAVLGYVACLARFKIKAALQARADAALAAAKQQVDKA